MKRLGHFLAVLLVVIGASLGGVKNADAFWWPFGGWGPWGGGPWGGYPYYGYPYYGGYPGYGYPLYGAYPYYGAYGYPYTYALPRAGSANTTQSSDTNP